MKYIKIIFLNKKLNKNRFIITRQVYNNKVVYSVTHIHPWVVIINGKLAESSVLNLVMSKHNYTLSPCLRAHFMFACILEWCTSIIL